MKKHERRVRLSGRIVFIIYLMVLVYFMFFADWFGRTPGSGAEHSYNLIPFREIGRFINHREKIGYLSVFLNIYGNILGFLPVGFALPIMSRRFYSPWKTILFGFLLSLIVEGIQFLTKVGTFDVDDIILNTIGTAIGYGLFMAARLIRRKVLFG